MTNKKLKDLIKEEVMKILRESNKYPDTAEEYAAQINSKAPPLGPGDWGGELTTDPEHWAKIGVHTGEELAHYLAVQEYSDTYKEFYGRRPRGMNLNKMSIEKLESMTDTISGIDPEHVTHPPVVHEPSWDDEPPSVMPMDDGEAEEWQQWTSKNRDRQRRRS